MNGQNEHKRRLAERIEEARRVLNNSIDRKEAYDIVYKHSVELDRLITAYLTVGN